MCGICILTFFFPSVHLEAAGPLLPASTWEAPHLAADCRPGALRSASVSSAQEPSLSFLFFFQLSYN